MHAHGDDGLWHRRTRDIQTTACGQPLFRLEQALRHETYKGPLCPVCFTSYELSLSAEIERAEQHMKNGDAR